MPRNIPYGPEQSSESVDAIMESFSRLGAPNHGLGISFEMPGFEMGMLEYAAQIAGKTPQELMIEGARVIVSDVELTGKVPETNFYADLGYDWALGEYWVS